MDYNSVKMFKNAQAMCYKWTMTFWNREIESEKFRIFLSHPHTNNALFFLLAISTSFFLLIKGPQELLNPSKSLDFMMKK